MTMIECLPRGLLRNLMMTLMMLRLQTIKKKIASISSSTRAIKITMTTLKVNKGLIMARRGLQGTLVLLQAPKTREATAVLAKLRPQRINQETVNRHKAHRLPKKKVAMMIQGKKEKMNLFKAPNFRKKSAVTQAKEQMHPSNRNSRTSRRHLSQENPGQRMRRS